jgi:hypothetical protein
MAAVLLELKQTGPKWKKEKKEENNIMLSSVICILPT